MAGGRVDRSTEDQRDDGPLTTNEVAALLRISPRTIRRWAAQGRLPTVVMSGGRYGFEAREIKQLARRLGMPTDE